MEEAILKLEGIYKSFGDATVLKDINLELEKGEVHGLVGENGAGKSTLVKILNGAYKPDKGTYILRGKHVKFSDPAEAQKYGVLMIYQELSLMPYLTVAENIMLGKYPKKKGGLIAWKKMYSMAKDMLDELQSETSPYQYVKDLSVANQQEVEIARSLLYEPDILIMDEPTSALSPKEINQLYKLINHLTRKKVTIIYISHKLEEVYDVADKITVLRDGHLITTKKTDDIKINALIEMITGRTFKEHKRDSKKVDGSKTDKILELRSFTAEKFFYNINLNIKKGEILGVLGLVGSGKSELAKALFGGHPRGIKYTGKYWFDGKEIDAHRISPKKAVNEKIGLVSESRREEGIIPEETVSFNFTLAILSKISRFLVINMVMENKLVASWVNKLKVRPTNPNIQIKNLSGGNQQKVVIGKWLVSEPKLLILDEPTRGVDVSARQDIYEAIRSQAKAGKAILVFSSDLREILQIVDRTYIMRKRTIVDEVYPEDVTEHDLLNLIVQDKNGEF